MRQTAAQLYRHGLAGTPAGGPLPSIEMLLQAEMAEAAAARAAAARADAAAAVASSLAASGATSSAAPLVPAAPATGHEAEEQRLLTIARNASEGLLYHSVALLEAFGPMTRGVKTRLQALAASPDELDVRAALSMHGELAKSLGAAAVALERLVSVQSTLSARPTSTTTLRVERGAERLTDDEIKRRAGMVAATLRAQGIDLELGEEPGADPEPIEVEALPPAPAAAESAPAATEDDTQEAA